MAVSKEKIKKLIKLGDLLSASFTLEEAYGVISREMSHLFPAGVFFRYDEQKNLLEQAAESLGAVSGSVHLLNEGASRVGAAQGLEVRADFLDLVGAVGVQRLDLLAQVRPHEELVRRVKSEPVVDTVGL